MDNPIPGDTTAPPEDDPGRKRRIAWEATMIAKADVEIEAGLYADAADIDAWIDSVGTDHELPPPPTRRR